MLFTPKYNIIVVGDRNVGKSTLIYGKLKNKFVDPLPPTLNTIQTDINNQIKLNVDSKPAKLFNWEYPFWLIDTDIVYNKLKSVVYSHCDLILLCFDISNKDSLASISEKWIQEILIFAPGIPLIVVGLKSDLRKDGEIWVSRHEGKQMADIVGAEIYLECSAKTGIGINQVYDEAVRTIRKIPHNKTCTIQ